MLISRSSSLGLAGSSMLKGSDRMGIGQPTCRTYGYVHMRIDKKQIHTLHPTRGSNMFIEERGINSPFGAFGSSCSGR